MMSLALAGRGSGGLMTSNKHTGGRGAGQQERADIAPAQHAATPEETLSAQLNLGSLLARRAELFTSGESTSLSQLEAHELLSCIFFTLGIDSLDNPNTIHYLANSDLREEYSRGIGRLQRKLDATMDLWQQVCATMPPIKNIALRDTLASIGELRRSYDVYFAAHEIPCSIDYPLHEPVPEHLQGVDYIYEWLMRALMEAEYIAQFELEDCIAVLEASCPDYRGLLINLYEPIAAHFGDA